MARRLRPSPVPIDTSQIQSALKPLQPLQIEQVRRTGDERLYDSLIEQHHYLGYEQPVGEHLKYLVWSQRRPIACLAWSSALRHLGCRDRFIGWDSQARHRNIRFIACNTRFLIVPWVQVPHLASHILGRIAQRVSPDWEALYFLETYVLRPRSRMVPGNSTRSAPSHQVNEAPTSQTAERDCGLRKRQ